jgi:hypothetical protein
MIRSSKRISAVRLVASGVGASLVGGVVAGLLARGAMAILADAGGSSMTAIVGRFTLEGTIRVVLMPMIFGIPFAILLLAVGRLWRARPILVRAAAYAISAMILPGLVFLTDTEFDILGPNRTIGPWLFVPPFLAFGAIAGLVGDWLLDRGREPAASLQGAED